MIVAVTFAASDIEAKNRPRTAECEPPEERPVRDLLERLARRGSLTGGLGVTFIRRSTCIEFQNSPYFLDGLPILMRIVGGRDDQFALRTVQV